jgi:adenylate kinase family enzyme
VLSTAIAVIGPPAAGKTTLTIQLGQVPGRRVFRLREHVPQPILAATASDAQRQGWIDDFTVFTTVHEYVEAMISEGTARTLLLDNFPGTGTQVSLFLSVLRQLAPACTVSAIELAADPLVLHRRARTRRVCHYCERDPLCDPRLPAEASQTDPGHCARCDHLLDMRRGDEPTVYTARMRRYQQLAEGIREAFTTAGIGVRPFDSSRSLNDTAEELTAFLTLKEH